MSYGVTAALQEAVYQRLSGDPALAGIVGAAIFDAVPSGNLPGTYVSLGAEEVRDASDATGGGAEHFLTVSVVTDETGFRTAKQAAAAISDSLIDAPLTLSRGRLVGLRFVRANARRVRKADIRRIDITFRARVEDD